MYLLISNRSFRENELGLRLRRHILDKSSTPLPIILVLPKWNERSGGGCGGRAMCCVFYLFIYFFFGGGGVGLQRRLQLEKGASVRNCRSNSPGLVNRSKSIVLV